MTRDIIFKVNKALTHVRVKVVVRLIKIGYIEKGNLIGIIGENAYVEDLFAYT